MTEKPLVVRVHHVQITIPADAEDEARKFYCDILGLQEIPKPDALQSRGGFWLEVADFQVHVGTENSSYDRARSKAHIAYQVENLDKWREKLEANGAKILEGVAIPDCRRFEFRDPFGNRVEFLEKI